VVRAQLQFGIVPPCFVKTDAGEKRAEGNLAYYGKEKAEQMRSEILRLRQLQKPEGLKKIYESLKDNPLVQWKWHIKHAVGLTQPEAPEAWPED